jgi:hypothetical protein
VNTRAICAHGGVAWRAGMHSRNAGTSGRQRAATTTPSHAGEQICAFPAGVAILVHKNCILVVAHVSYDAEATAWQWSLGHQQTSSVDATLLTHTHYEYQHASIAIRHEGHLSCDT